MWLGHNNYPQFGVQTQIEPNYTCVEAGHKMCSTLSAIDLASNTSIPF